MPTQEYEDVGEIIDLKHSVRKRLVDVGCGVGAGEDNCGRAVR
jgi:hypothetical protein